MSIIFVKIYIFLPLIIHDHSHFLEYQGTFSPTTAGIIVLLLLSFVLRCCLYYHIGDDL